MFSLMISARLRAVLIGLSLIAGGILPAHATITVTDMLQRKVTMQGPAKRVIVAESRHILTLGLLEKNPFANLVGWGDDLQHYSPDTWKAIEQQYPESRKIPVLGTMNTGTFSMEATIAAKPDLVIFTLYGPPPQGLDKLDAAHIPYVFVDFFRHPLTNTVPSMRLLGTVLGKEAEADRFINFWQQHMDNVTQRLTKVTDKPVVFFHLNPGRGDCCFSSGPGNMSDFIAAAGGHNLGQDVLSTGIGKVNPEYVLSHHTDYYLMGGGSTATRDGLQVGPGATPELVEKSIKRLTSDPQVAQFQAVKDGHAGGIWLFFFDTPLYFIGVEEMAKMFHPTLFADVDPDATLHTLTHDYLSVPLQGTFWGSLEK